MLYQKNDFEVAEPEWCKIVEMKDMEPGQIGQIQDSQYPGMVVLRTKTQVTSLDGKTTWTALKHNSLLVMLYPEGTKLMESPIEYIPEVIPMKDMKPGQVGMAKYQGEDVPVLCDCTGRTIILTNGDYWDRETINTVRLLSPGSVVSLTVNDKEY